MRILQSSALTLLLGSCSLAMFSLPSQAQISIGISVNIAPPILPVYVQPLIPGPDYIWAPGYWAWDGLDYYWVPGTWVLAPRPGLLWTPGYWGWNDGSYAFHNGYWGAHVGFYGGVSYGFGYSGNGYEGGYWNGGNFFYNKTVNNIGNTNITNVYSKTVIVNNTTINNVSFNGGPGGVAVKPTPQQVALAHEEHVAPTAAQVQHVTAASKDRSLFVSANHGRPPVAATVRPGVLKGPGVVAARGAPSVKTSTTPDHDAEDAHKLPSGKAPVETGSKALVKEKPPKPAASEVEKVKPHTTDEVVRHTTEPKKHEVQKPEAERVETKRPEPKKLEIKRSEPQKIEAPRSPAPQEHHCRPGEAHC